MADTNFDPSLKLTLAHEGGFVNNPRDPGGPTNKGITQAVYDRHRHAIGQPTQPVRYITDAEVSQIYRDDYWKMIAGPKLPVGCDYAIFDYAVNSGISKAIKDAQRCVNDNANFYGVSGQLKVDGIAGQSFVSAMEKVGANGAEAFVTALCDRRLAFCKQLKTWGTFGKGWQRRIEGQNVGAQDGDDGVVDLAVQMARLAAASPAAVPAVVVSATAPGDAPPANVGIVLQAPAAIGAYQGENAGKAFGGSVSLIRTVQGAGAALAAAGVTGNTLIDASATAKDHVNGTLIGQIALIAFVLLMVAGVGLIVYKAIEDRNEKRTG